MKRAAITLAGFLLLQVVCRILNLHFVNPYIDRLVYYTTELSVYAIIVLSLVLVRRKDYGRLIGNVATIALVVFFILAGVASVIAAVNVAEAGIDLEKRMNLGYHDGWTYYAHTLRRSALDDLLVDVKKEKHLALGFLLREVVTKDELKVLGVQADSVNAKYLRFYTETN